jgi:flagellar basal-body rod modification protein FlgD
MPINRVGNTNRPSYNGGIDPKLGSSNLGYEDFITLLTAQLKNQNMFEPANDTEFIAQMAQFSSLQQINRLTTLIETSHAVSFVGKNVIAKTIDDNKNIRYVSGVVESVSFDSGSPRLLVNDKYYDLSDITDVIAQFGEEMMEV